MSFLLWLLQEGGAAEPDTTPIRIGAAILLVIIVVVIVMRRKSKKKNVEDDF